MKRRTVMLAASAALMLASCAKDPNKIQDDGAPAWLDDPYAGQDPGTHICTTAQSDFAAADVEAAKTDAETAAKNRIADQINGKVGRLTERTNTAMKDLTAGKVVGERTVKDINQNFVEMALPGLRFLKYHYMPDRISPQVVMVWACVNFDSIEMSKQIMNAMMDSAKERELLEGKHQEAMIRFEEVRKQYLGEEQSR